jgi:hypothetical protein
MGDAGLEPATPSVSSSPDPEVGSRLNPYGTSILAKWPPFARPLMPSQEAAEKRGIPVGNPVVVDPGKPGVSTPSTPGEPGSHSKLVSPGKRPHTPSERSGGFLDRERSSPLPCDATAGTLDGQDRPRRNAASVGADWGGRGQVDEEDLVPAAQAPEEAYAWTQAQREVARDEACNLGLRRLQKKHSVPKASPVIDWPIPRDGVRVPATPNSLARCTAGSCF